MVRVFGVALASAAVLAAAACGGGSGVGGTTNTSQSECSGSLSTVTYGNFAQAFLSNYCTRCHAQFGTYPGAAANAAAIDAAAGARPGGSIVNTAMPPAGNLAPSTGERTQLACWVALGGPQ